MLSKHSHPTESHPSLYTVLSDRVAPLFLSESDSASFGTLLKGLLLAVALSFRGFSVVSAFIVS